MMARCVGGWVQNATMPLVFTITLQCGSVHHTLVLVSDNCVGGAIIAGGPIGVVKRKYFDTF